MLYFLYFHQSIKKSFREISSLIFHMILFKYTVALMNPFLWIEMKKIKGAIWVFSSSTDIPPVLTWQPLRRSSSSSRTGLNTCQTPTMGCLSTADISVIWGEFLVKWAILSRGTVGSQTGDIISTFEAIVWFFFLFFFFYPALHGACFRFKDNQDVLYSCFYVMSSLLSCIKNASYRDNCGFVNSGWLPEAVLKQ